MHEDGIIFREPILELEMIKTETSSLLTQWHSGDQGGLDALIERHMLFIRAHVRKRLGPVLRLKAETDDYVQDVVMQFLKYAPRFTISNDEHFRALVIKAVENLLRDKNKWYTAKRRKAALENPLPSDTVLSLDPPRDGEVETPSQCVEREEQNAWLRFGMEFLEYEDRELLVLRQWDEHTFAEIGKRLNIAADAARMRHNRAMVRLADVIGKLRRGDIS